MPSNDANNTTKITDFNSVIKNLKDIATWKKNVTTNDKATIKQVLQTLRVTISFALADMKNVKGGPKLLEDPIIIRYIKKLQIAYIYYFAHYLNLEIFGHGKSKSYGDVKDAKELSGLLEETLEKEEFKFFKFLLEENTTSPFYCFDQGKAATAANFIPAIFDLKPSIVGKSDVDSEKFLIDDLFTKFKTVRDLPEHDKELKALVSEFKEKPLSSFIAEVLREAGELLKFGTTLSVNEFKVKPLSLLLKAAKAKDEKFVDSVLDIVKANEADGEKLYSALSEYYLNYQKEQKEKNKQKTEEAQASFEDQLAMNMADYITGRITALEFQRRDRQIREANPTAAASVSRTLDEDDEEQS